MYSFNSKVRYSETDERGYLSITAVMNYLQDCSTFQSEELGVGVEYLSSRHYAWWLSNWEIELISLPKLGDEIVISTWAHAFKGFYGYRNFTICDTEGNYYVKADSIWFHFDTEKGTPSKASEEDVEGYMRESEERLPMKPIIRKIHVPDGGIIGDEITVAKHHLDTNHHVNNAQYIEMARETIKRDFKISEIDVQYIKAAVIGDTIVPVICHIQEGYIVDLTDGAGHSYAVVQMISMQDN